MTEAVNLLKAALSFATSPEAAAVAWLLFVASEALGSIPSVKANAVYQALASLLRWVYEKMRGKVP